MERAYGIYGYVLILHIFLCCCLLFPQFLSLQSLQGTWEPLIFVAQGMNWIRDVFSELDSSGDGMVSLQEFENQLMLGFCLKAPEKG